MNTANDLLRRAEECLRHAEYPNDYREEESDELRNDIHKYLDAPKDELLNLNCKSVQKRLATQWGFVEAKDDSKPVAWMFKDGALGHYDHGDATVPLYLHPPTKTAPKDEPLGYLHPNGEFDGPMPTHLVFPIALYAHPPTKTTKTAPMKPMTEEEIKKILGYSDPILNNSFVLGIRFAERHHGIGG